MSEKLDIPVTDDKQDVAESIDVAGEDVSTDGQAAASALADELEFRRVSRGSRDDALRRAHQQIQDTYTASLEDNVHQA